MKANRKFVEEKEAVSAVIGVILMVAITVAIAATVYVYVSGLVGPSTSGQENASVVGEVTTDQLKLILSKGGENYDDGYDDADINIYVEGIEVVGVSGSWKTGEQLLIGTNAAGSWKVGEDVETAGVYSVTCSILETVVYNGDLEIN
jgi:flagellin-like protein